jgi:hypothetical protein
MPENSGIAKANITRKKVLPSIFILNVITSDHTRIKTANHFDE